MKLGVYTAILHDKPLREALEVIASLGLSGAEINAGGFLPTPHLPVDDLLSGAVTPRRLPRHLRRHRCVDRRAELQRQPAASRSRGRPGGRRRSPQGDPRRRPARRRPRRHDVGPAARASRRPVAGVARKHLGLRLSRLTRLPVGRGCPAVLDRDRRAGPPERCQGGHRDASAEPGVQPADAASPRRPHRRDQRRRRDGPVAPVLAGHRPDRRDRLAGPAGVTTPPPRTPGSTRTARSTACSTSDSPGSR